MDFKQLFGPILEAEKEAKRTGDWNPFVSIVIKSLKKTKNPKDVCTLYIQSGNGYMNLKDYKNAIKWFSKSLEKKVRDSNPDTNYTELKIASCNYLLNNDSKAMEIYESVLPKKESVGGNDWILYSHLCYRNRYFEKGNNAIKNAFILEPYKSKILADILNILNSIELMDLPSSNDPSIQTMKSYCLWVAKVSKFLYGFDTDPIIKYIEGKGIKALCPLSPNEFTSELKKSAAGVIWIAQIGARGSINLGPREYNISISTLWQYLRYLENLNGFQCVFAKKGEDSYVYNDGRIFDFDLISENRPNLLEYRIFNHQNNETLIGRLNLQKISENITKLEHNISGDTATVFLSLIDKATIVLDKDFCAQIGMPPL